MKTPSIIPTPSSVKHRQPRPCPSTVNPVGYMKVSTAPDNQLNEDIDINQFNIAELDEDESGASKIVDLTGRFKQLSGVVRNYKHPSEFALAMFAVTQMVNQFGKIVRNSRSIQGEPSVLSISTDVRTLTTVYCDVCSTLEIPPTEPNSKKILQGIIQGIMLDDGYRVSMAGVSKESIEIMERVFNRMLEQHNFYQGKSLRFGREQVEFIPVPSTNFEEVIMPDSTRSEYQMNIIDFLTNPEMQKITKKRGFLLYGAPGCHRIGQHLLMFDGSVKKVEDIVVGDFLMGPDSKPREVLELKRGNGKMVQITPVKGSPFVVNDEHVMTIVRSRSMVHGKRVYLNDGTIDVPFCEWERWSESKKSNFKLFHTGIEFPEAVQIINPYFLGLLLGDGFLGGAPSKRLGRPEGSVVITTMDDEIVKESVDQAERWGVKCIIQNNVGSNRSKNYRFSKMCGKNNPLITTLDKMGLYGKCSYDKFIPKEYKVASRSQRLSILAGLMDTDGHYDSGGKCFDYISKSKALSEDVAFVARSLGFFVTLNPCEKFCQTGNGGIYYRLCISGDVKSIPTKISHKIATARTQIKGVLRTGFKAKRLGKENFYGFTLSGDGRYLMDDFLVTHNTGKTSGVKAMFKILAGTKVTCIYVSDESFDRLSVQDVFAFINKYLAPALVVFEDIDLIAPDRRDGNSRLIGPLLSALNGIEEQKKPIVIMATTNRVEVLDAAVTRPCRFDRRIEVGYPSEAEMHSIFRNVAGFEAPAGCFRSDSKTRMTGAHVEEIYRTAALLAQQKKISPVDCVKEAVDTVRKHFMIVAPKLKGFNIDEDSDQGAGMRAYGSLATASVPEGTCPDEEDPFKNSI